MQSDETPLDQHQQVDPLQMGHDTGMTAAMSAMGMPVGMGGIPQQVPLECTVMEQMMEQQRGMEHSMHQQGIHQPMGLDHQGMQQGMTDQGMVEQAMVQQEMMQGLMHQGLMHQGMTQQGMELAGQQGLPGMEMFQQINNMAVLKANQALLSLVQMPVRAPGQEGYALQQHMDNMAQLQFMQSMHMGHQDMQSATVGSVVLPPGTVLSSTSQLVGQMDCAGGGSMTSGTVVKAPGTGGKAAKKPWSIEEDQLLRQHVELQGPTKWSKCAEQLIGRTGNACRERWFNQLQPDIKKSPWTDEEDRIIIEAFQKTPHQWAIIAKQLPGRPENAVKNHWNSTIKRRIRQYGGDVFMMQQSMSAMNNGAPVLDSDSNGLPVLSSSPMGADGMPQSVLLPQPGMEGITGPLVGQKRARGQTTIVFKGGHKGADGQEQAGVILLVEDDGWDWLKYGQKKLSNTEFSVRHYFRCKKQKCQARKFLDQTLTHPIQSKISNIGEHTCILESRQNHPVDVQTAHAQQVQVQVQQQAQTAAEAETHAKAHALHSHSHSQIMQQVASAMVTQGSYDPALLAAYDTSPMMEVNGTSHDGMQPMLGMGLLNMSQGLPSALAEHVLTEMPGHPHWGVYQPDMMQPDEIAKSAQEPAPQEMLTQESISQQLSYAIPHLS